MHNLEMKKLMDDDAYATKNMEENDSTWPKLKRNQSEYTIRTTGTGVGKLTSLFSNSPNISINTNSNCGMTSMSHQRSRSLDSGSSSLQDLFEDVDAQNQFEAFLATIDRFEDEFDQQAYTELIPLNIRLALENQIFGWNHLYSAALGHVVLPLIAYTLTYWIVSIVGLKGVTCRYSWSCTVHKVYHTKEENYIPILGMSLMTLSWVRIGLGLWSALSAFRSIRRRRMVWLHHQATEYFKKDTAARQEMKEVDRKTLLGRIRNRVNRRKHNNLMKRIDKAERRFEKRARRRREFHDGSAEYESDHHRRVQMLSGKNSSSSTMRSQTSTSIGTDSTGRTNTSSAPSTGDTYAMSQYFQDNEYQNEEKDSEHFVNMYQRYRRTSIEGRAGEDDFSETHFYGHTMPAFAMESITKDQIRFQNGLLQNMAYAHGGFFGSAPFMLANPHWINILRTLMPDVYVQISRRVVHTPSPQLIHWAENNPVVAAYGTAHELEYCGKIPTLEWDVFLDPHLVSRVEVVLDARDTFLNGLAQKSRRIDTVLKHKRAERRFTDKMDGIAVLLDSDERRILHFYNTEIEKRVMLLLERMLIAHGNLSQLALEQTGHLKQYIFSRVKHTQRTLGGGICAKQWIMTFTEALKMSTERDDPFLLEENIFLESGSSTPTSSAQNSVSGHISPSLQQSTFAGSENAPLLGESKDEVHSSGPDIYRLDLNDTAGKSRLQQNNKSRDSSPMGEIREEASFTPPCSPRSSPEGSPRVSPNSSPKIARLKPSTSFDDLAQAAVTTSSIAECMKTLQKIMNCSAPLGLILDIKSRHVPKRVWALLLDALRDMGVRVEGVATFYVEDIRDISLYCATPMNEIIFFHTAGDLQKACHDGRIRRGDSCFFNAGSLFWNYPDLTDKDFYTRMLRNVCSIHFNAEEYKKQYKFQSYARVVKKKPRRRVGNSRYINGERLSPSHSLTRPLMRTRGKDSFLQDQDDFTEINFEAGGGSTIQQYKEHFELKIGLYVQEFAIDDKTMELLVKYVNGNPDLYAHGFSWGGVNGVTVRGIQPGRLTNTDGLWNQRYAGERWDRNLYPPHTIQ